MCILTTKSMDPDDAGAELAERGREAGGGEAQSPDGGGSRPARAARCTMRDVAVSRWVFEEDYERW